MLRYVVKGVAATDGDDLPDVSNSFRRDDDVVQKTRARRARLNVIWAPWEKNSDPCRPKSPLYPPPSRPTEGAYRDQHGRGGWRPSPQNPWADRDASF